MNVFEVGDFHTYIRRGRIKKENMNWLVVKNYIIKKGLEDGGIGSMHLDDLGWHGILLGAALGCFSYGVLILDWSIVS